MLASRAIGNIPFRTY